MGKTASRTRLTYLYHHFSVPSCLQCFLLPPRRRGPVFPHEIWSELCLSLDTEPRARNSSKGCATLKGIRCPPCPPEIHICQEPEVNISNANNEKRHLDTLGPWTVCLYPQEGRGTIRSLCQERPPMCPQKCRHRWAYTEKHTSASVGAFCFSTRGCVLSMRENDRNEMQDGISESALITIRI